MGLGAFALCLAVATLSPANEPRPWIEVTSPHFRIVSDADEEDARRVAHEFEVIRNVFRGILPALMAEPRRPLTILAARNEDVLLSLLPQFADQSTRPVGVFLPGALEHHIVLRVDSSRYDGFQTIYHEYFHLLTSINSGQLPMWLMEGLAEVYSNTVVRGSTAEIGNARLDHLDLLAGNRLIPLTALLTDNTNPHERNVLEASLFYAQSWALAHLILLGDSSGTGSHAISNYITRLQQGEDSVPAFEAAIADLATAERALEGYARRGAFYAIRMDAPAEVDEAEFDVRVLSATESLVEQARVLSHGRHKPQALALLAEALAEHPHSPLVHEALGMAAWYQGEHDEADRAFHEALRLGSTSYMPHYLGALMVRPGSSLTAADRQAQGLRRTIELNPRFAPAYASLATLMIQFPDGDAEALELARTATELEPNTSDHWLTLAEVWLAMDRPEEARNAAEHGQARARGAEERAAAAAFLESLEGARAYFLRGNALRASGDLAGAAAAYRAAIQLAPEHTSSHNGLGLVLSATGDVNAAIKAFQMVVRLDPENAVGYHNLANALRANGAVDDAIATYQEAIRLDPDHADTHQALGDAFNARGEREAAIAAYRRAIDLDPTDLSLRLKLQAIRARQSQ